MSHMGNRKHILGVLICLLGALYYSYEYFLRIAPSVMEHALREHFDLSATGFGMLSSSYYYAYVPMQLPVGVLLDRYGPRALLTLACFVCVAGTFLFTSTDNFTVAFIGRFLVGFGSSFAFVGVLKLATIWLPEDNLGMVAGITAALGTIGAMLGDNFLGALVIQIGWSATLKMAAYAGLVLMVLLWLGIRNKPANDVSGMSGTIDNLRTSMRELLVIARKPQIWINCFFGCLVYLPTTVFAELWGIPYLMNAHGLSEVSADFANSVLFLGFTIGAPTMGFISDTLKCRRPPMLIGAFGAAIVMSMILYAPGLHYIHICSLMFILGLLYSAQCLVFPVSRESSPVAAAATAMAFTNMVVMLGAMILQPLVGHLLDYSYMLRMRIEGATEVAHKMHKVYTLMDYQLALSVIPIGILIAGVLVFFLRETYADMQH
ncbi:MAG: MFS transporter [Legionellaceae bacterium]|nr:MFS transporter [Legionellaceae bacterium]